MSYPSFSVHGFTKMTAEFRDLKIHGASALNIRISDSKEAITEVTIFGDGEDAYARLTTLARAINAASAASAQEAPPFQIAV